MVFTGLLEKKFCTGFRLRNWSQRQSHDHALRNDAHKPADADRKVPVGCSDYGFTNRSEKDGPHDKLAFLAVSDPETGWPKAIPVPGKAGIHGGINVTSYLAAELCRLMA